MSLGSEIRDPEKTYPGSRSRIPDPGVKKAPDPGSATLGSVFNCVCRSEIRIRIGNRKTKMNQKEKKVEKINFMKCMFSLVAGGFSCNLKAVYGGKRIKQCLL
jgi:hypothetical protein